MAESKQPNQVDEAIFRKRQTFIKTMTVNERMVSALYDTGANESLIRKDLVLNLSEIKPSPIQTAKLFDGSDVDVLGYVNVVLTREDKTVAMPFHVVAELRYPLIMGSNWIQRSGTILTQEMCLLFDRVEVDEIGMVDALIGDSGCSGCFVGKDALTDSIKSKIKPLNGVTVILPDGSRMNILGTVNLRVSYLGKTVELPFEVAAELIVPMILGTTWIRKSRAIMQSDGNRLGVTFSGKEEKKGCRTDLCPSPYVSVNVEEIGKVRAQVDSGCPTSCIRRDQLTELQKSKATSTFCTSYLGNGTKMEELEHIRLNITSKGRTICLNVNIASESDQKLRLGLDWIDQTRAAIQSDGSNIIVSLPKKTKSNRLIAYLSKQWNSTFGSITRISSLVSNLC